MYIYISLRSNGCKLSLLEINQGLSNGWLLASLRIVFWSYGSRKRVVILSLSIQKRCAGDRTLNAHYRSMLKEGVVAYAMIRLFTSSCDRR